MINPNEPRKRLIEAFIILYCKPGGMGSISHRNLSTIYVGFLWEILGVGPVGDFNPETHVDRFLRGAEAPDSNARKIDLLQDMIRQLQQK